MRLRRNWQGEAALGDMPGVLCINPASGYPDWAGIFGRKTAIHMEIGSGKGDFILGAARAYPNINFLGIEKSFTVMYAAAKKNQVRPLPNLRFLPVDAGRLDSFFCPGQVDRIYLNFSDPWPKNRHEPRRLTAKGKISLYRRLLKPGGQIHFKTDQGWFFDYSLRSFVREGWSVGKITRNLYRSGFAENIATEYEKRFLQRGQPIYRFVAWRPGAGCGHGAQADL